MQFVEVTGENADTGRVAKTILHRRIVQPTENLKVLEMIRKLRQQSRRLLKRAARFRDQFGLIKAEVIDNRQQPPRRFRLVHLPQTLHPWQQQRHARAF